MFKKIISFFFPITCSSCGCDLPADDNLKVCAKCQKEIKLIDGLYCQLCGMPLKDGGYYCFLCRKKTKKYYENIRSSGVYDGVLRLLIHKFKYKGRDFLSKFFGSLLVETLKKQRYINDIDYVVPVPLHWFKKYKRGYNQAELLAFPLAVYLNKPLLKNNMIRSKFTLPQFTLNKQKRIKNLSNVFKYRNNATLKNKTILLVDDICTTGTTIDQCSKVLKEAGAKKVYALVLARD